MAETKADGLGVNEPPLTKTITEAREGVPSWESITISFVSDERIQIFSGTSTETRNYHEFGLEDGRSKKPNKAWLTLRAMAQTRGVIRDAASTGGDWPKIEKRVQEIRKVLRKHFGITGDPVPFVDGTGYQARFRINCAPSFDA